jgi:hypothetical protein
VVNVKTPRNPVQKLGLWPPKKSKEYMVLGDDNWWKVAKKFNIDVWALIEFNFQTRVPEEVNWYLRELVGCKHSTDGKNYAFSGADPSKGKIYLPLPNAPMPIVKRKTWVEKLAVLKMQVEASNDPRKPGFLCVLNAMENRKDDRVILWDSIAPDDRAAPPLGVRRRAFTTLAVDPQWLFDNIKTWQDVANLPLGDGTSAQLFVTSLHKFLFDVSDGSLGSFGITFDSIVETHHMLDYWASQTQAKGQMPREYFAIKEFVRLGERSPGSVMNCIVSAGDP